MIPVTPTPKSKDVEKQGASPKNTLAARRQLFIKLGVAAGGVLILILAFAGYMFYSSSDDAPSSKNQLADVAVEGQQGLPEVSISALVLTKPLEAIPLLFKRHTVPAVAVTIVIVLVLILAVALPIMLSQPAEIVTEVDEEPKEHVNEDEKKGSGGHGSGGDDDATTHEAGFFDNQLYLGLTIAGIVLGAVIIAGVCFGVYRYKSGKGADNLPTPPLDAVAQAKHDLITKITKEYDILKDTASRDTRDFSGDLVPQDAISAYVFDTDAPYKIGFDPSNHYTLKLCNIIYAQKCSTTGVDPYVLRAYKKDNSPIELTENISISHNLKAVNVLPDELKKKDKPFLEELLKFLTALNEDTSRNTTAILYQALARNNI